MSDQSPSEDAWLRDAFRHFQASDRVVLGLGHDTAALRIGVDASSMGSVAVVTQDVLVEGRHFVLGQATPEQIAYKALAVNLSDLAAAAAHPLGFLVGAVLPAPADRGLFDSLMRGFARAANVLGCPCVGGDTNVADGPLTLAITALGSPGPMGVLSRSGAQVGDVISVTGPLGGSLLGRHLHPQARNAEALVLAAQGVPHAMMDLSDGLSRDLPRLCRASGVGALVQAERIPIHADALRGEADASRERTPLEHALHDGEDFELLLAHAPLSEEQCAGLAAGGVLLHAIGHVRPHKAGLHLQVAGAERPWDVDGFDHFTSG